MYQGEIVMGWYGTYKDYDSVKDYAQHELNWNGNQTKQLMQSIVSNVVYTLVEVTSGEKQGLKFISVDIVKKSDNEWMHKSLSEADGPLYYNCPEKMLKASTDMRELAIAWRNKCRLYRKEKKEIKSVIDNMQSGRVIVSKIWGRLEYKQKQNTRIVCTNDKGQTYAYKVSDFSLSELKGE